MSAAHVAYLVRPTLERRYPTADECLQIIVGRHTLLILELVSDLMDLVDLLIDVLWVIFPVEFLSWGADNKSRQPDHIYLGRIFDIEERPEPLLAGL
jgi:hypothetical protein